MHLVFQFISFKNITRNVIIASKWVGTFFMLLLLFKSHETTDTHQQGG
jgi:hypothetical protein